MSQSPHYRTGLAHRQRKPARRRSGMQPVVHSKDGVPTAYSVRYGSPSQRHAKRTANLDVASAVYGASRVSRSFAFRAIIGVFAALALFWGLFNGAKYMNVYFVEPWRDARSLSSLGYSEGSVNTLMQDSNRAIRDIYLSEDSGIDHGLMVQLAQQSDFSFRRYEDYQQAHAATGDTSVTIKFAHQVVSTRQYDSALGARYYDSIKQLDRYDYDAGTAGGVVQYVGLRLDKQPYEDVYAIKQQDSITALVDKRHGLTEDYLPLDMRSIGRRYGPSDVRLRPVVADSVERMFDSARVSGLDFYATSGYRSYFSQARIYQQGVATDGQQSADESAARPGHSEHQTGLAVDMVARNSRTCNLLIECFDQTRNYDWLLDNAYKFGFIQSYTEENQWATDYGAEAWHWRYVGVDVATEMRDQDYASFQQYAFDKSLID